MTTRMVLAVACVLVTATAARAQSPYNLAAPVPNLATIFTDLFGPRGLIVDRFGIPWMVNCAKPM